MTKEELEQMYQDCDQHRGKLLAEVERLRKALEEFRRPPFGDACSVVIEGRIWANGSVHFKRRGISKTLWECAMSRPDLLEVEWDRITKPLTAAALEGKDD